MSFAPTSVPDNLTAIRNKVRRVSGRPSPNQLSDNDIDDYINTFYVYDFPEHLRLESLRVNFQFTTTANVAVYDFPRNLYLTNMPPVFIAGYQSYMTQSRQNFFRTNPQLNFLQSQIYTGTGIAGPYTGQFCTQTPILQGFKPNPPGAFTPNAQYLLPASTMNWNVLVSGQGTPDPVTGIAPSYSLIDDGLGHLIDPNDPGVTPAGPSGTGFIYRGTINYVTGALDINTTGFIGAIAVGNPISVQYIPYVASRPQSLMFFQDQFIVYPIPNQAYTVSFEAYKVPTAFLATTSVEPQLQEWWQAIAMGAALKILEDNGDMDGYAKFRPVFDQYMTLVQRRTIVQQTSERTSTIYSEQNAGLSQFPFGNLFSGLS